MIKIKAIILATRDVGLALLVLLGASYLFMYFIANADKYYQYGYSIFVIMVVAILIMLIDLISVGYMEAHKKDD